MEVSEALVGGCRPPPAPGVTRPLEVLPYHMMEIYNLTGTIGQEARGFPKYYPEGPEISLSLNLTLTLNLQAEMDSTYRTGRACAIPGPRVCPLRF